MSTDSVIQTVNQFMNTLFPMEALRVFMIKEILKHKMKEINHQKIYILCGSGANGKTTFQKFVKELIPCEVVFELGEEDENFWDAINRTYNTNIPIFLAIYSPKELDVLSSSELWENAHFIPMDSKFKTTKDINPDKLVFHGELFTHAKLKEFAEQFMQDYS